MYDSVEIAKRIKATAKEKGLTVKQVLEDADLGFNTMSNMKTSMPKADNLAKIADSLGVSVDLLLGRDNVPSFPKESKAFGLGDEKNTVFINAKDGDNIEFIQFKPDNDIRLKIIEKLNSLSDSQLDRLLGYLEALTE